ncbi:hypothetical protein IAD21_02812 [Abditibacteriota bacterium]|nr:hypothetical protein IAD21_02812 [Abditibacteriota bacterium]
MAVTVSQDELLLKLLMQTKGKAEIINGRIVEYEPKGDAPGYAEDSITYALSYHVTRVHHGQVVGANKSFLCNLPHRRSFSPDAAYYMGPRGGMKFYPDPPVFAVEVRSENDYGRIAEEERTQKRADYFAAGTQVVWDVDLHSEDVVRVYTPQNPTQPTAFKRGEMANANLAVPGWAMNVDRLFRPKWENENQNSGDPMKPNNDKPPLPLPYSLERSLDPAGTKKAFNLWGTVLLWLAYLYIGFMVLVALNYAWLNYARTHGYYSQGSRIGVHK